MTRKTHWHGLVVVAAATALAACSSATGTGTSGNSPAPGGDLVMARASEPQSLLPSTTSDNGGIWIIEEIFDTLTVPAQDGKSVNPSLATSWEQSADKLSWTFHLRDDVKFTNGQPVTSADVKFSIEQNQKEEAAWSFIDNVVTKMDTPDAQTIIFHTEKSWAPLPADMALFANSIVPKDYAGMSAEAFAETPIGSGPFKFENWTKGSSLTIVKNDKYWKKGVPYLNSVKFTVVPDSNTRNTQLSSGQIGINEFPAYSSIKALESQPNVNVGDFESSKVHYLTLNTGRKPFDDVNVRTAISQAIDKKAMVDAVLYGHGEVAGAYLSPTTWAHNDSIKADTFDLAAAKAALAKSSMPQGFTTTITIRSGNDDESSEAQLVQSDLAKIGIKVKIQLLDPAAKAAASRAENFDMGFGYYTTDVIDPDEMARFAGTYDGGTLTLRSQFKSARMDELADTASSASDQSARKVAYDEMQQIIAENAPFVTLFYLPAVYSFSKNVHDFHPGATGNYFLENVKMSK